MSSSLALLVVDAAFSSSLSAPSFLSLSGELTTSTKIEERRGRRRSSNNRGGGSGGIQIVGLPGGQVQSLPQRYAGAFRRWIVTNNIVTTDDDSDNDSDTGIKSMEAILGAGGHYKTAGWVDPTTTNELWWPNDLTSIQARPTLDILVRNGVSSYVSAGLDICVPTTTFSKSSFSEEEKEAEKKSWRNHGLNSQPISRQWTTLDIALEYNFHIEGFIVGLQQQSHDQCDGIEPIAPSSSIIDDAEVDATPNKERINEATTLFPQINNDKVRNAINAVTTYLAEADDDDEQLLSSSSSPSLLKGFHIISYPLMKEWIDLPSSLSLTTTSSGNESGSEDNHDKENDSTNINTMEESVLYTIICMGTSEPDASKLLGVNSDDDMDEELLIMSATSVLEIDIIPTMGGGKSQYLPEVYKNLYTPTTSNRTMTEGGMIAIVSENE